MLRNGSSQTIKERKLWMRNKKLWILVATWAWWTVLIVAPTCSEGNTALQLNTVKSDLQSEYFKLIPKLRNELGGDVSDHGIRRLRNPAEVTDPELFIYIDFIGNVYNATFIMDVTNANLLGYLANNVLHYFKNVSPALIANVFPDATHKELPFDNSYSSMQNYSRDRNDIELGIVPLAAAIDSLYYSNSDYKIAESLIICTEMFPETARFRYIEGLVRRSVVQGPFKPDALMYSVVEKWETLSQRIQQSYDGSFDPVQLAYPDYWDNVGHAITRMSLMLFVCDRPPSTSLLISSFVDHDTPFCSLVETTVRIVGREGLCVDVKDGNLSDGNEIQSAECKSNHDANQLWTSKKDGTIRSNGKCLTAASLHLGQKLVIYNCTTAPTNLTSWQVWQNGTIINPVSGLVLNVPSTIPGTTLDVQANTYAESQGWIVTNVTQHTITSIVVLNDLCMQAIGSDLRLADCAINLGQRWALFKDGTIRPQPMRTMCLSCDGDCVEEAKIILTECGAGSSTTRWFFHNDGRIINLLSGLVMDVKQSNPSLKEIIAYPPTGQPNQEWFLLP